MKKLLLPIFLAFQAHMYAFIYFNENGVYVDLSIHQDGVYDFKSEEDLQTFFELFDAITSRDILHDPLSKGNGGTAIANKSCRAILYALTWNTRTSPWPHIRKDQLERFIRPCKALHKATAEIVEEQGRNQARALDILRERVGANEYDYQTLYQQSLIHVRNLKETIIPAWDRLEEKLKNN